MKIALAICTWNRCDLLRQTLEQITRLVVPHDVALELVVVNNNCTDGTDRVIEQFERQLPIRRIFEPTPGLSHARNAAIDATAADYLAFTDDDVLVDARWLMELIAAIRQYPEAAAFGGSIDPWFAVEPDRNLLEAFPILRKGFCGLDFDRPPGLLPDAMFVFGANMAYRRSALDSIRFDASFGPSPTSAVCGDEIDVLRRLRAAGGTVVWWPSMHVRHYVAPSRMTQEYLERFTAGKGREHVLFDPDHTAPSWRGIPRWLWRETIVTSVKRRFADMTGIVPDLPAKLRSNPVPPPQPPRRVRQLLWASEDAFRRGMIHGYRDLTQRRQPPTVGAAPQVPSSREPVAGVRPIVLAGDDPGRVSVVIPCYNGEPYLGQTLRSILAQTHAPYEVLVVDDGSTDGSKALAESFGPPVRVLSQRNAGPSAARNLALRHASGDYIALMDADDLWRPEKLARQVEFLRGDPTCGTVATSFLVFGGSAGPREILMDDTELRRLGALEFLASPRVHPSSLLIRREIAMQAPFPEGVSACEDVIHAAVLRALAPVGAIRDVLTDRRIHPSQETQTVDHFRRAVVNRIRWVEDHYQAIGASSAAVAVSAVLDGAVDAVMSQYWLRRLDRFDSFRRQLLEVWPKDVPVPKSLHRRTLPAVVLKAKDRLDHLFQSS